MGENGTGMSGERKTQKGRTLPANPLIVCSLAEVYVSAVFPRGSAKHRVYEAVQLDLLRVKNFSARIFFEDELNAAIQGGKTLELRIVTCFKGEFPGEIALHLVALAPGASSFADEGFAVE